MKLRPKWNALVQRICDADHTQYGPIASLALVGLVVTTAIVAMEITGSDWAPPAREPDGVEDCCDCCDCCDCASGPQDGSTVEPDLAPTLVRPGPHALTP